MATATGWAVVAGGVAALPVPAERAAHGTTRAVTTHDRKELAMTVTLEQYEHAEGEIAECETPIGPKVHAPITPLV
jgi:hypothetical protein